MVVYFPYSQLFCKGSERCYSLDYGLRNVVSRLVRLLAPHPDCEAQSMKPTGLSSVINLIKSTEAELQENGAAIILSLIQNEDNVITIINEGAFDCLESARHFSDDSKQFANEVIELIRYDIYEAQFELLLGQLKHESQRIRERTATLFARLASSDDLKLIFINTGGLDLLFQMLASKDGTLDSVVEA